MINVESPNSHAEAPAPLSIERPEARTNEAKHTDSKKKHAPLKSSKIREKWGDAKQQDLTSGDKPPATERQERTKTASNKTNERIELSGDESPAKPIAVDATESKREEENSHSSTKTRKNFSDREAKQSLFDSDKNKNEESEDMDSREKEGQQRGRVLSPDIEERNNNDDNAHGKCQVQRSLVLNESTAEDKGQSPTKTKENIGDCEIKQLLFASDGKDEEKSEDMDSKSRNRHAEESNKNDNEAGKEENLRGSIQSPNESSNDSLPVQTGSLPLTGIEVPPRDHNCGIDESKPFALGEGASIDIGNPGSTELVEHSISAEVFEHSISAEVFEHSIGAELVEELELIVGEPVQNVEQQVTERENVAGKPALYMFGCIVIILIAVALLVSALLSHPTNDAAILPALLSPNVNISSVTEERGRFSQAEYFNNYPSIYTNHQLLILEGTGVLMAFTSLVGSSLIIHSILKEKRYPKQMYQRIVLGLSSLDWIVSLSWVFLGPWAIPKQVNFVLGAKAESFVYCNLSGFLLNFRMGTMWYSAFLALFFVFSAAHELDESKISKYIEFTIHAVVIITPIVTGISAVLQEYMNPLPLMPGHCWMNFYCDEQVCRGMDFYPLSLFCGTITIGITFVIVLISAIKIVYKVCKTEQKIRRYFLENNDIPSDDGTMVLRQETCMKALLYISAFLLVFACGVGIQLCPLKISIENRATYFFLGFLAKAVAPMQGFFNCFIHFGYKTPSRPLRSDLCGQGDSIAFA